MLHIYQQNKRAFTPLVCSTNMTETGLHETTPWLVKNKNSHLPTCAECRTRDHCIHLYTFQSHNGSNQGFNPNPKTETLNRSTRAESRWDSHDRTLQLLTEHPSGFALKLCGCQKAACKPRPCLRAVSSHSFWLQNQATNLSLKNISAWSAPLYWPCLPRQVIVVVVALFIRSL